MMLTPKQEAFCVALLDHAQTDAYRIAYPRQRMGPNALAVAASELAAKPKIAVRLEALRNQLAARTNVSLDRTVVEIGHVAYSDIGDIVDWTPDGLRVRPSQVLDERARRAIQSIKIKQRREYDGPADAQTEWEVQEIEVKLHPKLQATDQLMKHLGGYPKEGDRRGDTFVDARSINFGIVDHLTLAQLQALADQPLEEE